MSEYAEIEDPEELRRFNRRLSARLKRELPYRRTRTIGYPVGNFEASVRFQQNRGGDILYWCPWESDDGDTSGSFFGHGSPKSKASLNIDVQFNVPVKTFHRKSGGAYLRHLPTGAIVIAHRGIVTLGHGRVSRTALFSEMAATVREVDTSAGSRDFLLVTELESPSIVADIDAFAVELRRTARALGTGTPKVGRDKPDGTLSGRLREYFDEFAGQRKLRGRRPGVADCYHGAVVKALRDAVPNAVKALKNQAIDLTIVMRERIYLFEVKTSAKPQSIYTAIGQITAHAPAVSRIAASKALVKVIVLPEHPNARLRKLLNDQLGIRLVLFNRNVAGNVSFIELGNVLEAD